MQLVCKSFSIPEFEAYVSNLKFNGWTPNFIEVHNTSAPTQKLFTEWHSRPNWTWEQWLKNLASYYTGLGWNGCPHLFVGYDRIGVLNDLTIHGTHSPSWNKFSWGVETVAEFDIEPFNDGVRANLIAAVAILHSRIGLNPSDYKLGVRGLHFHKEDAATTHKNCPGKNLIKQDLVDEVVAYMNKDVSEHSHPIINEAVHTADVKLTDNELLSVKWVQSKLCLTQDGIVGNLTKAAVKEFQKRYWLTPDGIAGPLTRQKMKEILK